MTRHVFFLSFGDCLEILASPRHMIAKDYAFSTLDPVRHWQLTSASRGGHGNDDKGAGDNKPTLSPPLPYRSALEGEATLVSRLSSLV